MSDESSYLSREDRYFADLLSHACPTCKSCFHMPQNQREISSHNSPRCPTIWNHSLILMLDSTKYALQSPINYISPRWSNAYMLQKFLCSQKYISPREIERRRLTQRGRRCTEVIGVMFIQQMDTFCRTTEGRSGTNSSNVDDHSTEMQHHKSCNSTEWKKIRSPQFCSLICFSKIIMMK